MTDPRISKLPVWAQKELSLQAAEVENLKRTVAQLTNQGEATGISYRLAGNWEWGSLPAGTWVKFQTGTQEFQVGLEFEKEGGGLRLIAGRTLTVYPVSANRLRLVDE